jgi:hypothetical protein
MKRAFDDPGGRTAVPPCVDQQWFDIIYAVASREQPFDPAKLT